MTRSLQRLRFAAFVPVLAVLSACSTTNTNLVTGESQRGAYTWQQEVQLGTEADQQIVAQFGVYDDPALTAYVERIAQKVLSESAYNNPETPAEIRATPFHFRVLDSPVVNAFALPGGFVYVTRGLMAYVENEAQLAVVLGHEIGHVLARHSSEQAARAQLGQFGLLGAAVLGGVLGGGRVAQGVLDYGGTGAQLLLLKYGRGAEREADRAGVAYAEFSGYDASVASRFFVALQRIGEASGQGGVPNFLSTHPDPGERAQTIPQLAAEYDPQGTLVNAAEYLRMIDGIVLGDDPRQGYVENSTFYHPELRFSFRVPQGWRTQNSPAAFVMGDPNGNAVMQLTLSQSSSAQAAGQELARQQGVAVAGQGAVTIGGNRGYRVEGTAQQQNGAVAFSGTFVEYGGNVYQLLGLTAAQNFSRYQSTFRQTADSFSRLTDSRYLNRQPVRLDVVTTSGSATLASLLRGRTLPPGLDAEQIAIMNQLTLSQTVPSGTQVKLPQ